MPTSKGLLLNAAELRRAVHEIAPVRIAVAYVGRRWQKYISSGSLKEIIVSPNLGTNPDAVYELMEALGDRNVHLLDSLHSKVYLGTSAAVVGSCNLSFNGLGDSGQHEAAYLVEGEQQLRQLNALLDEYRRAAKSQYPKKEDKAAALHALRQKRAGAIRLGLIDPESPGEAEDGEDSISSYIVGAHRIHVSWFDYGDLKFDDERVRRKVPELGDADPDDYFKDRLGFLEKDDVRKGDWLLTWHRGDDGYPSRNCAVQWMHVDEVIPRGAKDPHYTKLAVRLKNTRVDSEPFKLDTQVRAAVREALRCDAYAALRAGEDAWALKAADAATPGFIGTVKSLVAKAG